MREVAVHRARLGWSQKELAERAGVSVRTVRRAEMGESVADESAERILVALSIDPSALENDIQSVEGSLNQVATTPYMPFVSWPLIGITFIAILGILSGFTAALIWILGDHMRTASIRPFASLALLLPFGVILGLSYFRWQERLGRGIGPDCDRLIRAISTGRLRILEDEVYRKLEALRPDALEKACNSRFASLAVLHPMDAFVPGGCDVRLRTVGSHPVARASGSALTRKEIAWRSGVDPRTLRRLERGMSVSPRTRRLVGEVVGDPEATTDRMDGRYATALNEIVEAFQKSPSFRMFPVRNMIAPFSGVVAFMAVVVAIENFTVVTKNAFTVVAMTVVFLIPVCVFALSILQLRRESRERVKVMARMRESAMTILDGIRVGVVRHLSARQYGAVATTLGERELVDAMEAAPAPVRVL